MRTGQPLVNVRRATRYYFGGAVELTDLECRRMTVAMVRVLSSYGCFVKTGHPFKLGTYLLLTMTHSSSQFTASGRIVHQNENGVGVEFIEISPSDRLRLENCLGKLAQTENQRKL